MQIFGSSWLYVSSQAAPNGRAEFAQLVQSHDAGAEVVDFNGAYAADKALAMRALATAGQVAVDISNHDPFALFVLGQRELASRATTVAISQSGVQSEIADALGERLIKRDPADPAILSASVALLVKAHRDRDDKYWSDARRIMPDFKSGFTSARADLSGPKRYEVSRTHGGVARTRIGLWTGDLFDVIECASRTGDTPNIEAIVNSENTYMEMARVHESSISALLRHQGMEFSGDRRVTDLVNRQLLDKVAGRVPVAPASVYLTRAGRLKRFGVLAIAHVACVEPVQSAQAGKGYRAVNDLGACVVAVLEELSRAQPWWDGRPCNALFPLLAAGTGGNDPRSSAKEIVDAAVDYIATRNPDFLDDVYFLAYTNSDLAALQGAIDARQLTALP